MKKNFLQRVETGRAPSLRRGALSMAAAVMMLYSVLVNGVEVDWANITLANIPENGAVGDKDWGAVTHTG